MKTVTEFTRLLLSQAAAHKQSNPECTAEELATTFSMSPERAARLFDLLGAVPAEKLQDVRLVRVVEGETAPQGATTVGEFHFIIERVKDAAPARSGDRKHFDKKGGGGRSGGPGGSGGGGGGREGRDGGPAGERVNPRDVPLMGAGWMLSRAPRDFRDAKGGGGKRGGPRKPGQGPRPPRPGEPGFDPTKARRPRNDRGGRPGGNRSGGPGAPGGQRTEGPGGPGAPGGPRPEGARGPRPEGARGPRPAGARGPGGAGGPGGQRTDGNRPGGSGPRADRPANKGPRPDRGPAPVKTAEVEQTPAVTNTSTPAAE